MDSTKPSNPKDTLAVSRAPLGLISDVARAEEALAHLEGALKYGRSNYRIVGVKTSVYLDAMERHIAKYRNGEDRDPKTGVHHLGSVRACAGVLFDAMALGILTDDRPPRIEGFSKMIDDMEERIKHLREQFKDYSPQHYTIADGK